MFEVLVFVYENYYAGDGCPDPAHLERKLNAVGFESDEISDALTWLNGLHHAARGSKGLRALRNKFRQSPGYASPALPAYASIRWQSKTI